MTGSEFNNGNVLEAALAYHRLGWCVIPIVKGSKNAAVNWKQFQTDRPSEDQVRNWFSGQNSKSLAVMLGSVSGGLACRDYDDPEGRDYKRWSSEHPELSGKLPTVRSGKGYHVYFRCPGLKTKRFNGNGEGKGELRGERHYDVLPPSIHPNGSRYKWLVCPYEDIPELDSVKAGFVEGVDGNTGVTEETEDKEETNDAEDTYDTVDVNKYKTQIDKLIQDTLPEGYGQRNRKIFDFAYGIRSIEGLWNASPDQFKPFVRQWHNKGLPNIRTTDFKPTWNEFEYAWDNIKYQKGKVMERAMCQAEDLILANPPNDYEDKLGLLKLCKCLQEVHKDEPFFLSCNMAGSIYEVDSRQAHRWLWKLEKDGWIRTVEKGDRHKATRYQGTEKLMNLETKTKQGAP